ncbi:hypothetical protein [uncultured Polaribacter sp.]|uniref:hypothetical protein n=1 Tax=uncultured Polaribacter sp. TaxID=174711 RepID=UPI0030D72CB9|tara:strand:+ start:704 stop:1288 length:585 start_codon:yes stop_codon:yes gene_type:complete
MKTIKRRVLVVVFMLVTLFNYANNEKDFNNTMNANKVKVVFENVKKGHRLTFNDQNGIQLHSETISKEGELTKYFDLSSLNDGLYTIKLNKEFVIVSKHLEVKNGKVTFTENSDKLIFKPVIRNEDNLLIISKLDFDKKPLAVTLLYDGEIIFSETIKNELITNRVYKLDKNLPGEYTVIVYCNNSNYSNKFKI